jgi:Fur family ferric uptake transcriptional regulator
VSAAPPRRPPDDPRAGAAASARALARLRNAGVKGSAERTAVIEAFFSGQPNVTAEEVAYALRLRGVQVSLATVYRALALLVEHGLATAYRLDKGQSRFEPAAPDDRRDHLVCTRCRAVVEFADPDLEALRILVARHHGFEVSAHPMEIRGVCAACRSRAADETRA